MDPEDQVIVHREFAVEDRFYFHSNRHDTSMVQDESGFATYDEARQAAIDFLTGNGGGSFDISKRTFVKVLP